MKAVDKLNEIVEKIIMTDCFSSRKTRDLPIGHFTMNKPELYDLKSKDISHIDNWSYVKYKIQENNPVSESVLEFEKELLKSPKFSVNLRRKKYEEFK